jgi:hypothetical protein
VGFTPWQWIANPAFSSLPIEPAATPTSVSKQGGMPFPMGVNTPSTVEAILLSGREQKENGGSSKGEKYFGCGNHPSTKGHADAILNCEKNNWPNV